MLRRQMVCVKGYEQGWFTHDISQGSTVVTDMGTQVLTHTDSAAGIHNRNGIAVRSIGFGTEAFPMDIIVSDM